MELYLEPERPQRNRVNGQFLPGHKSPTKGRKRSEWMSAEKDRMLKELGAKKFREQKHPQNAGMKKQKVIAISDDGKWTLFSSVSYAADRIGGSRPNVSRCCRQNAKGGRNSDHRYMGIRFYNEDDDTWMKKVKNNLTA